MAHRRGAGTPPLGEIVLENSAISSKDAQWEWIVSATNHAEDPRDRPLNKRCVAVVNARGSERNDFATIDGKRVVMTASSWIITTSIAPSHVDQIIETRLPLRSPPGYFFWNAAMPSMMVMRQHASYRCVEYSRIFGPTSIAIFTSCSPEAEFLTDGYSHTTATHFDWSTSGVVSFARRSLASTWVYENESQPKHPRARR
jgi:hypothetical protein